MSDNKWITGLTPGMPVSAAAKRVLRARLKVVRSLIPPALQSAAKDPEPIHQLRVATRRARAALDLFKECLSERFHNRLLRVLRKVGRVAGPARDADVLLLRLAASLASAAASDQPGLHWVMGQLCAQRLAAEAKLIRTLPKAQARIRRLERKLVGEIDAGVGALSHSMLGGTLQPLALRTLRQLAKDLDAAGKGDLLRPEQLHRLRIQGKRFRYAIEVLAGVLPPRFKQEVYAHVETMQDLLGEHNDHAVAIERLEELRRTASEFWEKQWPGWRPGIARLIATERRALAAARARFARFWKTARSQLLDGQTHVADRS
jgi:CHAD domain-containing protein